MESAEYFAKNYPTGTLDKLVRVLRGTPFIGGSKEGRDDQTTTEELTLVFPNGSEETLEPRGSVYDYIVLGRERYEARPTLQQIEALVAVHGEPEKIIYGIDETADRPSFGPIEVPYEVIRKLIAQIQRKGDDANC